MPRETIPVCTVHDRFQTINGRWLDKSEDFVPHVEHTQSQDSYLIESPCDLCDDPQQLELFEEQKD
jgi:hypothetical protein